MDNSETPLWIIVYQPKVLIEGILTKEELRLLMTTELPRKKDELVRDLFIFCCFTGLSHIDMYNLTYDNLQTSFDGHLCIMTKRQKNRGAV